VDEHVPQLRRDDRLVVPRPRAAARARRLRLLLPDPVWVDLDEATGQVEAARAAGTRGLWHKVRSHAEAARDLLGLALMPGLDGDWLKARRRHVEDLLLEALEWQAGASLAPEAPDLGAAERAGRELIARSP
jgi:hypothetical protein